MLFAWKLVKNSEHERRLACPVILLSIRTHICAYIQQKCRHLIHSELTPLREREGQRCCVAWSSIVLICLQDGEVAWHQWERDVCVCVEKGRMYILRNIVCLLASAVYFPLSSSMHNPPCSRWDDLLMDPWLERVSEEERKKAAG